MKTLYGKKVSMTQVWDDNARVIPVSLIEVEPNFVNRIKTNDTDGYSAVQLAYGNVFSSKKVKKPHKGQFKDREVKKSLTEFRVDNTEEYKVGQELKVDIFDVGQIVNISGTSKGKGFAGTMKRHNFSGVAASHGHHLNHRKPGSIGACATPGRVFRGLKMAGRMGGETVTVKNLKIIGIDTEKSLLAVKGAIPGPKNSVIKIQEAKGNE
jgi:large subunit ribosomal protein L3